MSTLLYLDKKVGHKLNHNCLSDLKIDDIARMAFSDVGRQKHLLEILSNICCEEEVILYRQKVVHEMITNRTLFYEIGKIMIKLNKCDSEYNSIISSRLKIKGKVEMTLADEAMILRDYAQVVNDMINIYRKLDELFEAAKPSSMALKNLASKVSEKIENSDFSKLERLMEELFNSSYSYTYVTSYDDKLYPESIKYVITNGKYTGEKVTFFKKKENNHSKVPLNLQTTLDFQALALDSFNRIVVLVEDIFESLYADIAYISEEYIFFEFALIVYDMLGEKRMYCTFPELGDDTEYKNAKDFHLALKTITKGYSSLVYGVDLKLGLNESALVVGANNTGKTVLLKTIGINQVFSQCGLFVLADYAKVIIKEDIITIFSGEEKESDVGGRFEKEVIDIKEAIRIVDSKSLVIINEIFQSTFAFDGQKSLFDILNYFLEIDVCWIAVTHLTGIVDSKKEFIGEVVTYQTTGEEDKYKLKIV